MKKFINALEGRTLVAAAAATSLLVYLFGDWLLWPAAAVAGVIVFLGLRQRERYDWWIDGLVAAVAGALALLALWLLAIVVGFAVFLIGLALPPLLVAAGIALAWRLARGRRPVVCLGEYRAESGAAPVPFELAAASHEKLMRKLRNRLAKLASVDADALESTDRVLVADGLEVQERRLTASGVALGRATVAIGQAARRR